MKCHNFVYNYGFLADWFKANPTVKRKDFLQQMGMSDYKTLQNWVDGETMMPHTQMMAFCNHYNVPITAFFFDENADTNSVFAPITDDSIIEPVGGWADADRKIGMRLCDPRTKVHVISTLPHYVRSANMPFVHHEQQTEITDDNITHTERMRYLDVIERLNDRVLQLIDEKEQWMEERTRLLSRVYNNNMETPVVGLVAESDN